MQDRTAIITESGRGIGETAIQVGEHPANAGVCSRTRSEIDLVLKEIENVNWSEFRGLVCDIRVSSHVPNCRLTNSEVTP